MPQLTQIRKKYCPFCKEEHLVEYRGTCLVAYLDGTRLNVYQCPHVNREFKIKE